MKIEKKQIEFLNHPICAFEYFESEDTDKLIKSVSMNKNVKALKDVCDSTSGFGGKSKLITKRRTNSRQIRTMKGESIGRYEFKSYFWFEFAKNNITGRTTDRNKLGAVPKILLRKTGDTIIATYDDSGFFPEQSLYFLFNSKMELHFKYLLGILNSRLMNTYYWSKSLTNRDSIAQAKKVDLDQLPIRIIDFAKITEVQMHNDLVVLVDKMLKLHNQLRKSDFESQREPIERQIAATDNKIDELVYKLYGLTEEEIKIVEGK